LPDRSEAIIDICMTSLAIEVKSALTMRFLKKPVQIHKKQICPEKSR